MDILADKYIMSLYYDLEDEVVADIARRVKKTGRYTETAELMAKSMVEEGYSADQIRSKVMKMLRADKQLEMQIAENTKAHKQYVQDIINQTLKEAEEAGEMLMADAANMAWNNDLSMWEQHGVDLKKPNTLSQLMVAFRKQTNDMLRNLTRTTGFKDTNLGTVGILNAYQKEMDMALLKVATGTFSFDQAVNDCVHRLAKSGLRSIDYANGRTYQLDTAARMAVRTGMSQLSGKIMEENLKSSGQDLVITSQHAGSRPEHAPWQNKVFSYSGKSKKYPDFFKETGYGTATGLKGVNCTHDFYPFWEGASVIPEDIKYDEEYYKNTQKQRKMERDIRATKREIEAQKAIGGNTAELQSRLRRQTFDYRNFSDSVGLKVKNNRLRVKAGTTALKETKAYSSQVRIQNAGALSSKNDPYGRKREKHAISYYNEIRNRKSKYVVDRIAKNAGISVSEAKDIYEHIFLNEHKFENGEIKRFDPDYDMAESFRRILDGKNIKPHDITMLNHEKLESDLMREYNMIYEDAHLIAENKYNYKKELDEFLERVGS